MTDLFNASSITKVEAAIEVIKSLYTHYEGGSSVFQSFIKDVAVDVVDRVVNDVVHGQTNHAPVVEAVPTSVPTDGSAESEEYGSICDWMLNKEIPHDLEYFKGVKNKFVDFVAKYPHYANSTFMASMVALAERSIRELSAAVSPVSTDTNVSTVSTDTKPTLI